ncbi:hypothetical protein SBRY_70017 [Actinacidiphila bryophytorum]|uniref:Uncharacterized protein n=1 Tax=Actinacidiphila bryophytorum TaxID=1436133 RepID=A0A9W4H6W5_9ACTN|nr:hypothetical protein SBRY_70017 [Actinacidiphila bryophytorum]
MGQTISPHLLALAEEFTVPPAEKPDRSQVRALCQWLRLRCGHEGRGAGEVAAVAG